MYLYFNCFFRKLRVLKENMQPEQNECHMLEIINFKPDN